MSYNYDALGNVKEIDDYRNPTTGACGATLGSNSQTFEYDHLSRLTSAQGPFGANGANTTLVYDYSEIGNIRCNSELSSCSQTSPNYTYNASGVGSVRPHAVTGVGGNSYGYDLNGNMTSGAGRTIEYNQENRPVQVTVGSSIAQFTYDAGGGRIKKSSGGVTTIYVSSLYECVTGAAGTACMKYISAGGQRVAMKDNTSTLYFHGDHLGSTNIITEKQPGGAVQIAQALYYSPFGKTRAGSTNTAGGTRYRYTGQEIDSETADANGNALYNYGARLYDPALGRFVMADSIVPNSKNPQSLNRYSYVRNNPINFVDPSGHAECPAYYTCSGTTTTTNITGGIPTTTSSVTDLATGASLAFSYQMITSVKIGGTSVPILTYETQGSYQAYQGALGRNAAWAAWNKANPVSCTSCGPSPDFSISAPFPSVPQAEDNGVLSLFGVVAPAESAQPSESSGTPGTEVMFADSGGVVSDASPDSFVPHRRGCEALTPGACKNISFISVELIGTTSIIVRNNDPSQSVEVEFNGVRQWNIGGVPMDGSPQSLTPSNGFTNPLDVRPERPGIVNFDHPTQGFGYFRAEFRWSGGGRGIQRGIPGWGSNNE